MKKTILLGLLLLSQLVVKSQNLDSLSPIERDSILLLKAKEYTMKYGPDYYREYKTPVFTKASMPEYGHPEGINKNRVFYSVRIPYDGSKELFCGICANLGRYW